MAATVITVHEKNPQQRLLRPAVDLIGSGGVVVYPTDSCYAVGCLIGSRDAIQRIRRIRNLSDDHNLTLAVRDLSELGRYATVSDHAFRILKRNTPGPFTFLLTATRDVPRMLHHPKRRTIGIRVPDHPVTIALLEMLSAPLLTTSLILPGESWPLGDPKEIVEKLGKLVDIVVLAGWGGTVPTTVIDLCSVPPALVREGLGKLS